MKDIGTDDGSSKRGVLSALSSLLLLLLPPPSSFEGAYTTFNE
jgi:hypothetical protein